MRPMWVLVGRAACTGPKLGGNSRSIEASPLHDDVGMSPHHGQGTHRQPVRQSP
jgi:hypothetical protein